MDSDDLKQALAHAMGDLSPDDMERMAGAKTHPPVSAPASDAAGRGRIRGTIISSRGGDVFVDIGGKAEAFLASDEFDAPPAPGEVHFFVMQGRDAESGLIRLSLKEARMEADFETLQRGDVVEARVTGLNIGGLELTCKGIRAFMPKSQVDLHRVEDFTPYIGRKIECEVTEVDRKNKTLIVSRRKVLERQREQTRQDAKYSLAEGQTRKGVVRRLTEFGAFVDIGGIEGLLHIGDMSYGRLKHPREMVKENDEIEVQVLKIDQARDRVSLGLKQLAPDPWNVVEGNYRVGDQVDAKVVRLLDFGAFVELMPGVEGLIPISEMSWTQRVRHPKDLLKEGDSVRVAVAAVDLEKRKISLSLKAMGQDPWKTVAERYAPESVVTGLVMRLSDFGAFVQLEEGVEGLVHVSEMSDKRIRTPSEAAKPGQVVQVRVKSVDTEQRRISLSMRLAPTPAAEPAAAATSAGSAAPAAKAGPPKKKKALKGGLE
jgi:small subunit ribosomal protein S1